jgi:hypothetical protein
MLQLSKPFQSFYKRAKELGEGHSVKWNDVLLADSLVVSKTFVGFVKKKGVSQPSLDCVSNSRFALGGQRCQGGRTFLLSERLYHSFIH